MGQIADDDDSYTNKVDIWALGITLYNLSTGKYPYPTTNMLQLVLKIKNGSTSKLQKFSQKMQDFVNNDCLRANVNQRHSAQQLLQNAWFTDMFEYTVENITFTEKMRRIQ